MPADPSNFLKCIEALPQQCKEALNLPQGLIVPRNISNIIVCGMGGSAIGGDLLKSYMHDSQIPVFVNKGYGLPNFVNENSLVFCVSYSGNTEETLSAYEQAKKRNAKIVAITSGGKLAVLAQKKILIPNGLQPRAALGYLFFPMLGILNNAGIISVKEEEITELFSLMKQTEQYKEIGHTLSKKLENKIPLIYASELFYPVAYRFKTQINENSKTPAFSHVFPEMNHNELVSFKKISRSGYHVIMIRDDNDHPRIKKRMDICKTLLEEKVDVTQLHTKGKHMLARLFLPIWVGDFTSYYLALRYREDPVPVRVIEELKDRLLK